jgi:hypothetical protein
LRNINISLAWIVVTELLQEGRSNGRQEGQEAEPKPG